MSEFERRLAALDVGLLKEIESQTTSEDKRSLLAIHHAARDTWGEFRYLEIGSYLGGSLQTFVADPMCVGIVSIDPRPVRFPDQRGEDCVYVENSTARMLSLLSKVPGAEVGKIRTYDAATAQLQPSEIPWKPQLCFVDGEHTDTAVLQDARYCLEVVNEDGCIFFHDANIVYNGLAGFLEELRAQGRPFRAFNLPHCLFVVELGRCALSEHPAIRRRLLENHLGYLWSLQNTEVYRRYYLRRPVQVLRWWDDKVYGLRKKLGMAR